MFMLRLTTALAAVAVAALAAGSVAQAKDGDVRVRGTCTGSSTAKLKLSEEDGAIEVEFEVDQNRNGVPWKVTIRRNGVRVASTTATTRPPSGSFEVRRVVANGGGADQIAATAKSRSGETCSARASF